MRKDKPHLDGAFLTVPLQVHLDRATVKVSLSLRPTRAVMTRLLRTRPAAPQNSKAGRLELQRLMCPAGPNPLRLARATAATAAAGARAWARGGAGGCRPLGPARGLLPAIRR